MFYDDDYDNDYDIYDIYDMSEFYGKTSDDEKKAYKVGEKLGLGSTCQIWDESEMY